MSDTSDIDRPKKKKKKKKSNKNLIIALIAGGAALLIGIVVLILVLTGGGREDPKGTAPVAKGDAKPAPPEKKVVPGPLVVEKGKTRLGKYIRPLERTESENVLKNLGLAYRNFELMSNRGPKDQKELEPYYERNFRVTQSLDPEEGWLTFIWGAGPRNMPEGPSRTILAYEREPDGNYRYVLFGDGSFTLMPEDQFAKAPRAKGM